MSAKKEDFYIVRVKRAEGAREVKVATTKGAATTIMKALEKSGTASDPVKLTFPEKRADRARCLQAIMNGEDLSKYQDA